MRRASSIALLAIPLSGSPASAQHLEPAPRMAPREAPALAELEALARERSPAILARRAAVEAARRAEPAGGAPPDPMLETSLQNAGLDRLTVGDEEMSMLAVAARQALPWPGTLPAARGVAAAETAVEELRLAALERQVTSEVRQGYARLYALDHELELLDAARELAATLISTATSRYGAGAGELEAVLKAQLRASRLEEERHHAVAERAAALAALNRWLDRPGEAPLGQVTDLGETAAVSTETGAPRIHASPEVVVARAELAAAEARRELVALARRPGLVAGAGFGWRGERDPLLTLSLGVELPLWRRRKQDALLAAADAERDRAAAEHADALAAAGAETARLLADWRRAEHHVLLYREAIVPQSAAALDAARASYLAGRGDFSTVVEDFDLWLQARVELGRREADRFIAWAGLERLRAGGASLGGGR
jgi:outer membrane protein TolC